MASAGQRRAVIDIGTNSVKLLVGEVTSLEVEPLLEKSEQTRLGSGFYESRQLQPEAIRKTIEAVQGFFQLATEMQADPIRLIATSAARDARNSADLIQGIERAVGRTLEIISGIEEARLAYAGVVQNFTDNGLPKLVVDLGGGSTELILGRSGEMKFSHSYPIGTVRLLDHLKLGNPPGNEGLKNCRELIDRVIDCQILPDFKEHLAPLGKIDAVVGTGGTASIMAMVQLANPEFDRTSIENVVLSRFDVDALVQRFWNTKFEDRQNIPGLPSNRADIFLPGLAVYQALLKGFAVEEMRVSTRGLRFAVLASVPNSDLFPIKSG